MAGGVVVRVFGWCMMAVTFGAGCAKAAPPVVDPEVPPEPARETGDTAWDSGRGDVVVDTDDEAPVEVITEQECGVARAWEQVRPVCPNGETVQEVTWAAFGVPTGTCEGGDLAATVCEVDATSRLSAACVGWGACGLVVNPYDYGYPCAPEDGALVWRVSCSTEGTRHVQTCRLTAGERPYAQLQCPPGEVITEVRFASYGTPSGTCEGEDFVEGWCRAPASREVVERQCLGRSACAVHSGNEEFGDPCFGTGKRLAVDVVCGTG